jgi:hypothetical protein
MNGKLDVEIHNGRVVAVWFNCQVLPFEEHDVSAERAREVLNPDARITERVVVDYQGVRA